MGKGYSADFVREMTKITELLNVSDPEITLVDECDIICKSCPNKTDGKCVSEQKVSAIDRRYLKEYGLQYGDKIRWSKLKNLAYSRVIAKNRISEVCGSCEWAELCQKNISGYRY